MSTLFRHWLANAVIAYHRHQARDMFASLSDSQLSDIGLERYVIEEHVRASLPWQSFEPQSKRAFQPSIQGCG